MSEIALARINSLPSQAMQANVPQSDEPVFILTSGQLRAVIREAIQPLQDEVSQLRVRVTRQEEKIAALERSQDTLADNQLIQLRLIREVKEESHRQPAAAATTKKTTGHIDQLHKLMLEEKTQQVSIAKGARLLDISKERMRLLKPLILKDGRFELSWSTIKGKKAVVIRIRKFL
jgi:hypothetical protein